MSRLEGDGATAAWGQGVAVTMLLASSFLIAVVPNFSKLAYGAGASIPLVLTVRFAVTVLLLGVLGILWRSKFKVSRRVLRLCVLGGVATAAMSFGVLFSITLIDISLAILILYLHPIFIAWAGHLRGVYPLSRFRLACCALILLGLALALSVSLERLDVLGLVSALVGAFGAAGLVLATSDAVGEAGTLVVNFYSSLTALFLVGVFGPWLGHIVLPATALGWFGLLGTGMAFCFGLVLFLAAVPLVGMVRATMITVVEPLLAILLAMALFGESLTLLQWSGAVIVIAGLVLLEVPPKSLERFVPKKRIF